MRSCFISIGDKFKNYEKNTTNNRMLFGDKFNHFW